MTAQKPREIALRVLRRRAAGTEFAENLLEAELSRAPLATKDRALCQELVYGVVRRQSTLDWLIARKTGGRPQKEALQILLRLGLYQLFYLDRIPDHAAVNETVEIAKQSGFGPQAGFLNAVLRGYLREREATERLLAALRTEQPHLAGSHPEWLWQRWRDRWGAADAQRLMDWNNSAPRTFARVNTLEIEPARLLTQWREQENVEYDFVRRDWFPENLVFELKSHPPVAKMPSFRAGGFYLQDPSTLLAVNELDPQPGDAVFDLCAAPGGKTTFIAQQMRNEGRLVAGDISPERLDLLRQNCARLGVRCVDARLLPAPALWASDQPRFDRVLLDAPCSNTGVMRRRVDLRWRLRPEELARLRGAQLDLLRQAAALLKPGGVLVYSTCSLEPEENSGVVAEFLAGHSGFKLDRERELLPFKDEVDGAYTARLRRAAH